MKTSLYIALFVAFVDYIGLGLVYPLFSSMLFDMSLPLVPLTTSYAMRGFWLGLLLALMPLAQFFSSPLWGALSDSKGRKKPLTLSLCVALAGYMTALCGVYFSSVFLLLASRLVVGCAAGNMSIVQATIADLSEPTEKGKNFGLYGMALGLGFTLGPFFGGFFSMWGYSLPFLFSSLVIALNLIFVAAFFRETHPHPFERKISLHMALTQLQKAFRFRGLRTVLLASFFHNFGWCFFFEFIPVFLISRFQFSAGKLGLFFGMMGGFYALSSGLLIRPLFRKAKVEMLFFSGIVLTAMTIFTIPFYPSALWIWPMLFFLAYFVSLVTPASTTIISNSATAQMQGEALGILAAVNAAALVFSPLFSGALVGTYPTLPMWVGSSSLFLAGLIAFCGLRKRLW